MPSHYDILGVAQTASPDEIRRAYKVKALETHPDKLEPTASPEEKQASEARFHQVQEAFEVLRDTLKRRSYDVHHGFRSRRFDGELSEEQRSRMKDREDWARKSWQECEERIRILRERAAAAREERRRRDEAAADYRAMVERFLAELHRKNPEWAERKQKLRRSPSDANTRPTQPVSS